MHPQEPTLYRVRRVIADPDGTTWAELHDAHVVPLNAVIDLLNLIDPLVSKLALLGDLSPLVDEAPAQDKGRVAIGLLELVDDYVAQLAEVLRKFSDHLPHSRGAVPDAESSSCSTC